MEVKPWNGEDVYNIMIESHDRVLTNDSAVALFPGCMEPWWSHADFDPNHTDFYHREGTIVLKPHETFYPSYAIEV